MARLILTCENSNDLEEVKEFIENYSSFVPVAYSDTEITFFTRSETTYHFDCAELIEEVTSNTNVLDLTTRFEN